MSDQLVKLAIKNNVATITLNRPEVRNALNDEAHEQLYRAFEEADEHSEVRVIVLTGSGNAFCSGADLKSIDPDDLENVNYGRILRETYNKLITLMAHIGKPIIAHINGVAVGAGLSIALACDYRVADKEASFGLGFLKIGLVPDAGMSYYLPRLVGYPKALELAIMNTISSEKALEIGLISSIDDIDTTIQNCLALPPTAYRLMKNNFRESFDHHLAELLEMEVTAQREASESKEHRVALDYFVNKSKR